MTIDWQEITQGYNQQTNQRLTLPGMLAKVYHEKGSLRTASEYFGVSYLALERQMDLHRLPRLRRDWKEPFLLDRIKAIPDAKRANMTSKEIAKLCDCKPGTASQYCRKHQLVFKTTTKLLQWPALINK